MLSAENLLAASPGNPYSPAVPEPSYHWGAYRSLGVSMHRLVIRAVLALLLLATTFATHHAEGAPPALPAEKIIEIASLPTTPEKLKELRDQVATTPLGGAAMFVVSMLTYAKDPKLGSQFFAEVIDSKSLEASKADDSYGGFRPSGTDWGLLKQLLKDKPYTASCYVQGTSPEGKYALPSGSIKIRITTNQFSVINDTTIKVFVACSGADTARPITVKLDAAGLWKATEWSSLYVAIRAPK